MGLTSGGTHDTQTHTHTHSHPAIWVGVKINEYVKQPDDFMFGVAIGAIHTVFPYAGPFCPDTIPKALEVGVQICVIEQPDDFMFEMATAANDKVSCETGAVASCTPLLPSCPPKNSQIILNWISVKICVIQPHDYSFGVAIVTIYGVSSARFLPPMPSQTEI